MKGLYEIGCIEDKLGRTNSKPFTSLIFNANSCNCFNREVTKPSLCCSSPFKHVRTRLINGSWLNSQTLKNYRFVTSKPSFYVNILQLFKEYSEDSTIWHNLMSVTENKKVKKTLHYLCWTRSGLLSVVVSSISAASFKNFACTVKPEKDGGRLTGFGQQQIKGEMSQKFVMYFKLKNETSYFKWTITIYEKLLSLTNWKMLQKNFEITLPKSFPSSIFGQLLSFSTCIYEKIPTTLANFSNKCVSSNSTLLYYFTSSFRRNLTKESI